MKPVRVSILLVAAFLGARAAASAADSPAALSGFRADVLGNIDYAAKELISLAEAVPAEKYSWRPVAGVRSVSEVYMHVVLANYYIPSFAGVKMPEGIDREMEKKVTEKAQVVEALKKSIAHLHSAIEATADSELDTKVKLFGRDMSKRAVYILVAGHLHEHLGQSIAYARSNGVTPPWSASEGEPAKKTGK
jgi:uncharacterized damage-inducible protein DinB